jgi:hypothetical protein
VSWQLSTEVNPTKVRSFRTAGAGNTALKRSTTHDAGFEAREASGLNIPNVFSHEQQSDTWVANYALK